MKGTKGGKILLVFGAVVIVWALVTIGATLHAIHHDHAELPINQQVHVLQERKHLGLPSNQQLLLRQVRKHPLDEIRYHRLVSSSTSSVRKGIASKNQQQFDIRNEIRQRHQQPSGAAAGHIFDPIMRRPREDRERKTPAIYTGEIMEMEPQHYDTQGQATICVERNVTTHNKCQLRSCDNVHETEARQTDDYGFVVHSNSNTRGRRMVISGSAVSGSGCAISHKYKFLYIHVLKSGGMTVKAFLKRGLCNGLTQPCESLRIVDCGDAVSDFPHYFIFSFIRNPFSRIYSGYSMADSMKRQSTSLQFSDFVIMNDKQRRQASITSTSHYMPQAKFLFDEAHCPVFDYLGRLERFREDMQIILNQIQSPELQAFFDSQGTLRENSTSFGERKKDNELGGKLSNAYRSQGMVEAVASEFASDFSLLRYDPTQVP